jgi:hypothetical protein
VLDSFGETALRITMPKAQTKWVRFFEEGDVLTQGERIVKKFGSVIRLAELCGVGRSTVYGWMRPTRNRFGGVIPASMIPLVVRAAKLEGILLTAEDLDPRDTVFKFHEGENRKRRNEEFLRRKGRKI